MWLIEKNSAICTQLNSIRMAALVLIGVLFVAAIIVAFAIPNKKISNDPYDQAED